MKLPVNIALVGFGLAGRVFHAPLIESVEGLKLAAIVSSRKEEIERAHPGAVVRRTAEEVMADPSIDVVVVATPNDSHFDIASRALAAGKHVVIDKPMALTSDEARLLLAQSDGRVLSVFHNRRWDSDFLTLKRLIAEATLGEVVYFESHFDRFRPQVVDRWRERAGPATGTWYDLGPHLVDQALQLFGRPFAVTADLACQRGGAVTTDYFHVLMRYERLRVVLTGSSLASADDMRFIVHGTRASLLKRGIDPQEAHLRAGGKPTDPGFGIDPRLAQLVMPGGDATPVEMLPGDYRLFYASLRDTLAGTLPLAVTGSDGLAVMTVLEAAEASSAKRCEIVLAP